MSDPTNTAALRRSFLAEANRRLARVRSLTHGMLVERDMMGARNDPVAELLGQPGHRLAAFAGWFERVANEQLGGGQWWTRFLERAYAGGVEAAGALTGTQPSNKRAAPIVYHELAAREFGGIAAAMTQQVSRAAATAAIGGRKPLPLYQQVLAVLRKIGQARVRIAVDTLVVWLHNAGRLDHFGASGVARVGLIPEMLEPPRPSRFGLRKQHDHAVCVHDATPEEIAAAQKRVDEANQRLAEAELAAASAQADLEVAQARVETAANEAERTLAEAQAKEAAAEAAPERFRANAETQAARANIKASNAAVKEAQMQTALTQAETKASEAFQAAEQARQELAEAQLALAQATEPDVYKVRTAGDEKVCPICISAASEVYSLDEARGLLPLHPRCLPADTLVLARHGVLASSERWYAGQLVVIETASGRFLSCTPNHPVLTDRGWVAANLLDVGDHVISDGGREWESSPATIVNDNYQHVPTSIHHVARSFIEHCKMLAVEMETTSPNFHGDGMQGEIAIIRTDGELRNRPVTAVSQHLDKLDFIWRDVVFKAFLAFCSAKQQRSWLLRSANRIMGCLDLAFALFRRHLFPFQCFSFAAASMSDTILGKNARDNVAADVHGLGYGQLRHAPAIKRNDLFSAQAQHFGFGHVGGAEQSYDWLAPDAVLAREIIGGKAGPVFLDELVNVRKIDFAGHVYNLQTPSGHYSASGIITHNCRCSWEPSLPQGNYEAAAAE